MSLRDKLRKRWFQTKERAPEVWDAYQRLVRDLKASRLIRSSLRAGDRMPDFALPNIQGRLVSSAELLARGPLVLSFFRGGWCPYCTLELLALQEGLPQIERLGATLVAVTPDTGTALAAAKRDNRLGYELLSDVDLGVGLAFGIIFRVPDAIRALYLRLGIDLGARHGNDAWLLPLPATYIVARDGIIRHAELDPDFKKRMEPAEILRILRELVGGGAPATEKPGADRP
jgi:peroxiredoxin